MLVQSGDLISPGQASNSFTARLTHDSLAYTNARHEASEVHERHMSIVAHEDGNADEPEDAKLTSCKDTTPSITDEEGKESTRNRAELDHRRDVAFDICELALTKGVETERLLEDIRVEDTCRRMDRLAWCIASTLMVQSHLL